MALTKYKLGDLIELCTEKNQHLKYGIDDVKGISISKTFIETKADMNGVSLKPYILVKPDYFSYVTITSRNGEKISLAYNNSDSTYIVSSSYVVFKIIKKDILLSGFLFMFFNRPEFDRYSRFNSWGSTREAFSWNEMQDIEIDLPPVEIQQKYVNIYKSMLENQKCYETALDDLKLVCDAYIEDLRRKYPSCKIEQYITRRDERNSDNSIKNVMGISVTKEFRQPTSKVKKDELASYKIVRPDDISFVQTTHNEKVFAFACNLTNNNIVVSSVNEVFFTDIKYLLPDYLSLYFMRKEFDRYARFHSWGSARETFTWKDVSDVEIPIPDIKIQRSVADIYKVYMERRQINEHLKAQIKNICPILIRGAIEEGQNIK